MTFCDAFVRALAFVLGVGGMACTVVVSVALVKWALFDEC